MATIGVRGSANYVVVASPQGSNAWTLAATSAAAAGGHLATLTSAAEDDFVRAIAGPILGDYWIGLSDDTVEGVYAWVTGEAFVFDNFAAGEPNNFDGDEDYISGNFTTPGWNDHNDIITTDQLGGYVVEFTAPAFGAALNPFRDSADTFLGSTGNDTVLGFGGNDRLRGDAGNDTLFGGDGRDRLDGGTGDDRMEGGSDDDTYVVDSAADRIFAETGFSLGGGIDTVESWVDFTMTANLEILRLQGSADLDGTGNFAPESLVGNTGHNRLDGGGGNDRINGKAGDDTLIGGNGSDTLVGDTGQDVFVYQATGHSNPGLSNRDFINGFTRGPGQQDRIDLSLIDANNLTAANDAFTFIGNAAFGGQGAASAGQVRYFTFGGGNHCIVEADRDGNGTADFQIFVNLTTFMTGTDFVL